MINAKAHPSLLRREHHSSNGSRHDKRESERGSLSNTVQRWHQIFLCRSLSGVLCGSFLRTFSEKPRKTTRNTQVTRTPPEIRKFTRPINWGRHRSGSRRNCRREMLDPLLYFGPSRKCRRAVQGPVGLPDGLILASTRQYTSFGPPYFPRSTNSLKRSKTEEFGHPLGLREASFSAGSILSDLRLPFLLNLRSMKFHAGNSADSSSTRIVGQNRA